MIRVLLPDDPGLMGTPGPCVRVQHSVRVLSPTSPPTHLHSAGRGGHGHLRRRVRRRGDVRGVPPLELRRAA
jgi:hypothetical protein